MNPRIKTFIKTFGPGVMFAGTCIGGSHLVQSTKAGAFYGFGLLVMVLLANIFKYPFFEFASRYTNATGDSILEGYHRLGKWILGIYGLVTIVSMFIITAAIGTFTAGLANNIFTSLLGEELIPNKLWAVIMFMLVFSILAYGKFKILDLLLKIIGVVLVITVITAFVSVFINSPLPQTKLSSFEILTSKAGLTFAVALMGWMPTAVDMSSWHSLWTQERIKQTGYHPTLKETLLDFNIGYGITIVLAVLFLSIGAIVLYGHPVHTPEAISKMGGLAYANTLVSMFTKAVGSWSYFIIAIAAFATMFGTSITLIDGYCRSIKRTFILLKGKNPSEASTYSYLSWVAVLMFGASLIIFFFVENLGDIVNLATIISFIIAPFAAILNFKIVLSKEVPHDKKPPLWLKVLAIAGIIFLSVFTIIFLYYKF